MATTLTDNIIQNISAIVTLTNADKSEKYTNDVRTDLDVSSILPSLLEDIPLSVSQSSTQETQDTSSDEPNQEE